MRRKTSSRGLGTVEALMSVMGDMQALVMELKNLVEQYMTGWDVDDDLALCVVLLLVDQQKNPVVRVPLVKA